MDCQQKRPPQKFPAGVLYRPLSFDFLLKTIELGCTEKLAECDF